MSLEVLKKVFETYIHLGTRYAPILVSNGLLQILRFASLYLFANVNGPAKFGVVSMFFLLASHGVNANVGAINGLKRQIPLRYVHEPSITTSTVLSSIFWFNLLMTIPVSMLLALLLPLLAESVSVTDMALFVLFSLVFNTFFFYQAIITAFGRFKLLVKIQLLVCLLLGLIAVPAVFFESVSLFLAAYVLVYIAFFFFVLNRVERIRFRLDMKEVYQQVRIGFPIMLAGYVFLLFQSLDRIFVGGFLGDQELGYYAFGWLLISGFNLISNPSADLLVQKGSRKYGQEGDSISIFRYLMKYSLLLFGVLLSVAVVLYFFSDWIVENFFPKYRTAVPVIKMLILAFIVQQPVRGIAVYLYVVGKQKLYLLIISSSLLVGGVIYLIVANMVNTLIGYSGAYVISSIVYVVLMFAAVSREVRAIC